NRVILNLTNLLQRAIGENIELKTKLARQLKEINGDISALEQILTNLCLNARDAMPGGGVLSIHTEAVFLDEAYCKTNPSAQPGPYILLTISDTGSGMDEQTLTRIFDPFFTTKEVGRGSGLGLAMVFGLMKQLNGFIEVNSLPGRGSTFKLYFPTASGPSHHPPDDESPPLAGGTETILLIEDDPVVRKLVQRILTQVGYTVITAQNGQAALKLMQTESQRVHLIITDVVMPKMGGNQFYETVKEMPLNPKPRFIFMSGYETGDLHQKIGRELVAQVDFLSKPFSPATLTAKIREVLEAP
ncbi:MAG: response regulator, partial [Anaerolineae bacterium]